MVVLSAIIQVCSLVLGEEAPAPFLHESDQKVIFRFPLPELHTCISFVAVMSHENVFVYNT